MIDKRLLFGIVDQVLELIRIFLIVEENPPAVLRHRIGVGFRPEAAELRRRKSPTILSCTTFAAIRGTDVHQKYDLRFGHRLAAQDRRKVPSLQLLWGLNAGKSTHSGKDINGGEESFRASMSRGDPRIGVRKRAHERIPRAALACTCARAIPPSLRDRR